MKPWKSIGLVGAALLGGLSPLSSRAQVYYAASDFSLTNNPTGAWSFGQQATLGGAFSPFTSQVVLQPGLLAGWGAAATFPFVILNPTANPVADGTTTYPAGA